MRAYFLSHALLFVAGFMLVFVLAFGIPTTLLGRLLADQRDLIAGLGGLLIAVLGLHMAGVFRGLARLGASWGTLGQAFARLDRALDAVLLPERRWHAGQGRTPGATRSFVVGVTFAAGWTPCIGPLLGAVLSIAIVDPGQAMPLLLAYSLGLAIPFLVVAALFSRATHLLRRLNRHLRMVELASGLLLVGVGLLLIGGAFTQLYGYFSILPSWLGSVEDSLVGDPFGLSLVAMLPLAALAGLLSFLSPCVLPLVPVYLGYLTGTTAATSR